MTHQHKTITGFSKLSKLGKIKWIVENFFKDPESVMRELKSYWLENEEQQKILDEISENTISNYHLPYGVAPNFVINDKTYCIPMVIEESSVVAAAASAAKFWMGRGGIHAEVLGTIKLGHIHFFYRGDKSILTGQIDDIRTALAERAKDLTANMEKRGGGVLDLQLKDFTHQMEGYYQLMISFETCDSMGANFINSVLECYAEGLVEYYQSTKWEGKIEIDILMSILSNYTPESLVRAWVECPVASLDGLHPEMDGVRFADRFCQAIRAAEIDPYRATTHNKGIFNGIDAVVLATGNDFRAIEASGHAYAARDGKYRSLSGCEVRDGVFRFWLEIPLAVGTVGGLTSLHPIARRSFELLGSPDAPELMMIIASTGLAQNFSAIRSLITTGIQQGHMRMHLGNILAKLEATAEESDSARAHFQDREVTFAGVSAFISAMRNPVHRGETQTS